jgi:hypothetical protein
MKEMPNWVRSLRSALNGIELFDSEKHHQFSTVKLSRQIAFQTQPTGYLLQLALEAISGKKLSSRDKKLWVAILVFKDRIWQLSDWKGASWTLDGPPDSEADRIVLVRKLTKAAGLVERRLDAESHEMVQTGQFALVNQFMRIGGYYYHLRDDAEKLLTLKVGDEPPKTIGTGQTEGGGTIVVEEVTAMNNFMANWQRAEASAVGAIILFFGLMEVLFDACFAFGDRQGLTFHEFRRMEWKERFKLVMDIKNLEASKIYNDLLGVQGRYRHVFTHALPAIVVPHPQLGLISAETRQIHEPIMPQVAFNFDSDEIRTTFRLFDQAIQLFESNEKTWAAARFVRSPLPIPLDPTKIAAIVKHAGSPEDFEKEIDRRIEWLDYYANGGS